MKIKILASLLSIFFTSACIAQEKYTHEAQIEKINKEAYYKIVLSPGLIGLLNENESNLRLHKELGEEQPFYIISDVPSSKESKFIEYQIQNKESIKDSITRIEFTNTKKESINNISIVVTNTDVNKNARLSGSDNQKEWFVIKDNYLLNRMSNSDKTTEFKILKFPLINYQYLRLEIEDKKQLPINILKIGYYEDYKTKVEKTVYPVDYTFLKDSNKTSYYKVDFGTKKYFENIQFNIRNENNYSRNSRLKERTEYLDRKKNSIIAFNTIGSFRLNSNESNEYSFGPSKHSELYLEIDNKDDSPLQISSMKASFLNKYLVAKLEQESEYKIKIGDKSLTKREYDIHKFKDEIVINTTVLSHEKMNKINVSKTKVKNTSIFESSYIVWGSIIIVGLFLAFVSFKMIKEIK